MFDKLVESDMSAAADLRPRRKIFLVSALCVGVLFASAVVASIYAADFQLGTDNFDIAELLTPIAETEPAPEPEPRQQSPAAAPSNSTKLERRVLMASTDDFTRVPPTVSTAVNPYRSTSADKYENVTIGRGDVDPGFTGGPTGTSGTSSGPANSLNASSNDDMDAKAAPPPAPRVERTRPPVSGGVLTGKAKSLPTPTYSAMAKAAGAQGIVTVQVTIDESGKVISAKAVDGHIMLRPAAVDAARKAVFGPTLLTGVPVKVTGVITYNFKK